MCSNIKTLFNYHPPAAAEEANETAFTAAVDDIAGISRHLLASLATTAPAKNRDEEGGAASARR